MNPHLISAILKSAWAIEPNTAYGYVPIINSILGKSVPLSFDFDVDSFKSSAFDRQTAKYSWYNGWNDAPKGSIAIIPINGPMMKNDQFCGPVGMSTIGQLIKEADLSPNIEGIILKVDSPGGTVDGTVALANVVKGAVKPIITFADGLIASAALWVGSAANEIIAADNKTQIGSIGTMLSFADMEPAYEKLGVKFHHVVADQSKDKNKAFEDIKAGKYEEYKKNVLNPLAQDFIDAVKSNLPDVDESQLTGKVFFAEDVVGSLVTSIGNFDYAVSRMNELIQDKSTANDTNISHNSQKSISMKEFPLLAALLAITAMESTDEGVHLSEEQLEAIEAALQTNADTNTALETANTQIATHATTIADRDATIATLEAGPGEDTAVVETVVETVTKSEKKDENVSSSKKDFMENLDAIEEEFLN